MSTHAWAWSWSWSEAGSGRWEGLWAESRWSCLRRLLFGLLHPQPPLPLSFLHQPDGVPDRPLLLPLLFFLLNAHKLLLQPRSPVPQVPIVPRDYGVLALVHTYSGLQLVTVIMVMVTAGVVAILLVSHLKHWAPSSAPFSTPRSKTVVLRPRLDMWLPPL